MLGTQAQLPLGPEEQCPPFYTTAYTTPMLMPQQYLLRSSQDLTCISSARGVADTFVQGASERVNIVYAWVQQLLQERLREEGVTLEAPVGARMWQVLSEGYLHFEQCR